MVSTNIGILQANMTWLERKYGLSYHWLLDLFGHLKLPLFNGMADALALRFIWTFKTTIIQWNG